VASPSPPARWPAESLPVCGCGCGERVRMPGALFRAGHRQRLGHVPPTCPDCGAPVTARGRRGWPCAVTARGPNPRRPKLTLRCRGPAARVLVIGRGHVSRLPKTRDAATSTYLCRRCRQGAR
jgi:hypothetical protein